MNRRGFLKSLAAAVVGLAVSPSPTTLFTDFVPAGPCGEFVAYLYISCEYYVSNPAQCAMIEGMSE